MEYSDLLHNEIEFYAHKDDAFYIPSDKALALLNEITRLQSEARWIPVSERLPEVKKDTLFLCAFKDFQDKWKVDTRTFWADSQLFSGAGEVTYWQPLPQPPEEK
jgi:hypothetical protein